MDSPFSDDNWNRGHIAVASIIALVALPGLILYFMVVFVIIRNPKFADKPFYTFLLSLAVSDILQTLAIVFYLCPCIFFQRLIFDETFDWIFGVLSLLVYYAGLAIMAVIAVNRYLAVCRIVSYNNLFYKYRKRWYLWGAWLFGVFCSIWQLFPGFGYTYIGFYKPGAWLNVYFIWYDHFVAITVFLVIAVCYIAILLKRPTKINVGANNLLDQNARIKREKNERNLALQFGIIVLMFILYETATQFMALVFDELVFYVIITITYLAFIGLNPFVYLAFNSEVRSYFSQIYCKRFSKNIVVSSIQLTNPNTAEKSTPCGSGHRHKNLAALGIGVDSD